MKLTKMIGFTLSASIALSALAQADMYSSLSADDQATINKGGQVTTPPVDVDGSPWPRVTVYQRVEATPDQAAAVMFDYPLQKTMFGPGLDSSGKVTKAGITLSEAVTPGAASSDVNYAMVLPTVLGIGLPEEHYTVHDTLSTSNGSYQIAWTFVKASSMKDTTGVVAFERLGTGTLIGYTNFISPPRPPLAKLIKKIYIQMVQDTVGSLVSQITNERSGDPSKLNAQVAALNKALN